MFNFITNVGAAVEAYRNKKIETTLQDASLHQANTIDNIAKQTEEAISSGKPPEKNQTLGPRTALIGSPISMPPAAHLSNTTSFVPGMDLNNPTGALANAAFQAGSEGAGIAASGMEVGMGQLGQVMTLGMKQQTEMATMKLFTDMANAVAKEVRNVSKGVKDQAGN
jgi:hypothetical protein